MATIDETDIEVQGIRTRLRSAGPSDASEAVVMVHGNPGSGADWSDMLGRVGDVGRAIAPDMPGYGKAARPSDFDYSVSGYGRHLGLLLDQLGIRRAHLVLHDFGGPWGMWWASEHPGQVASLTLVNVGALPGYRWHKFARIWRTPVLGELFMLTSTRRLTRFALNAENPKPFPRAFTDRTHEDADWAMKRGVLKLYRDTEIGPLSEQLGDALRPLSLPALVLWGEGDPYLPVRYAEAQLDYFDAEVHRIPDAGHWPMIDDPERVAGLVLPFLRRQLAGA